MPGHRLNAGAQTESRRPSREYLSHRWMPRTKPHRIVGGWGGRQDQRVASLFQVLRTPRDKPRQFVLTTSQFTIGRRSILV
jgi:hypothetical protein